MAAPRLVIALSEPKHAASTVLDSTDVDKGYTDQYHTLLTNSLHCSALRSADDTPVGWRCPHARLCLEPTTRVSHAWSSGQHVPSFCTELENIYICRVRGILVGNKYWTHNMWQYTESQVNICDVVSKYPIWPTVHLKPHYLMIYRN